MHKHYLLQQSLLLALLTTLSFSCKSSPTGPHIGQNLQLSTDYVTCTEVSLKLAYSGQPSVVSGGEFKMTRDGDTVLTGNLTGSDTTVIDTTAEPEQAYTYKAYRYIRNQVSDTSLPLQVTTMDTTSSNFTWQTYTFGNGVSSSDFEDVAIINDTLAYAVGAIYLNDSTGHTDPLPYNLAVWNGVSWQVKRVSVPFRGYTVTVPLYGTFAFSPAQVWLVGDIAVFGNGLSWVSNDIRSLTGDDSLLCEKCWGSKFNDMYFVGLNGGIVHYDGYTWNKIESGTTLDVHDIWGVTDKNSGSQEVLAVGSDAFTNNGVSILQLSASGASRLQTSTLPTTTLVGIWSADGKEWYVCGDGLYISRGLDRPWQHITDIPSIFSESVRGTGPNDVFVVGDFGLVSHFNGVRWQTFPQLSFSNGQYNSVSVNGNTVIAVGEVGSYATVLIGKR